ncbi:hypothetical protein BLA29_000952 [Euroglyphus maynei]|uniref:CCHC-type domain-containing protein n=1 Tax=Euroglyphus maynei TaxID=6958 RepID=A0A1Y3B7U3_EURMA|nr:hypothetical protein BLA29_000952 [Euroglyphus maynei]
MDLASVRRQITLIHQKVWSRTVSAEDGEKVRSLVQRMVILEEELTGRSDQEIRTSGEYHQKVGEIFEFLDRIREKNTIKMEKLKLRFSGLAKDWPKFKILLNDSLSKGMWSIEEKFLLLENALPNHLKRNLPMTVSQSSFDWIINHFSERFGSADVQINQWYRIMANLKFAPSSSISDVVSRLDYLLFRANELGLTVNQIKFPFMEAMKSLIQTHRRLENAILPRVNDNPGDVIKVLKRLATGESVLGIKNQFVANYGHVWDSRRRVNDRRLPFCLFCGKEGHWSFKCNSGTAESRRAIAARKGLCFKCLRYGHNSNRCTQNVYCAKCRGGHSTALCIKKSTVNNMETSEENLSEQNEQRQASINMISEDKWQPCQKSIKLGNNSSFVSLGRAKISLTVNGVSKWANMIVVKQLSHDVLIGLDVIKLFGFEQRKNLSIYLDGKQVSKNRHIDGQNVQCSVMSGDNIGVKKDNVLADTLSRIQLNLLSETIDEPINDVIQKEPRNFQRIDGRWFRIEGQKKRLYIRDQVEQAEILKTIHENGHFGLFKNQEELRKRFWWPGWKSDLQQFLKKCIRCAKYKDDVEHTRLPMINSDAKLNNWQRLGLDICGPFEKSIDGNRYIVLAQDYASKFLVGKAMMEVSEIVGPNCIVLDGRNNKRTIHRNHIKKCQENVNIPLDVIRSRGRPALRA